MSATTTTAVTARDLIAGPPVVPLWPTAGRAVGCGRAKTYELARTGEIAPGVPVLRIGQRMRVRRTDLLRFLGVEDPHARPTASSERTA
jgi:hypothetical protein